MNILIRRNDLWVLVIRKRTIIISNNTTKCHTLRRNLTRHDENSIFGVDSASYKQFLGFLPTKCLSVSDHFVGLALKGLTIWKCVESNKPKLGSRVLNFLHWFKEKSGKDELFNIYQMSLSILKPYFIGEIESS